MTDTVTLENALRRDRLWVLAALVVITLLAWAYLISMAADMPAMAGMSQLRPWTGTDVGMMFLMWTIMMVGMMVPSAAPLLLLHARVCRRRADGLAPTGVFLGGYIIAWTLYSAGATLLQWGLEEAALLSPMMTATSRLFSGVVLIGAGVYQFTPYKLACLRHCRSPVEFLATRWREGRYGAFLMGMEHGAYCLGCCWMLMVVLFVVGVMDLLWVAVLAVFVLVEKVAPHGRFIGRTAGALLIASGIVLALHP